MSRRYWLSFCALGRGLKPFVVPLLIGAILVGFAIWLHHLNVICSAADTGGQIQEITHLQGQETLQPKNTEAGYTKDRTLKEMPSTNLKPKAAKQYSEDIKNEHYGQRSGWWSRFQCDANFGDYAIALFTLFLAVFTVALWIATARTANIAERSMRDLERAYLFFHDTTKFVETWISTGEEDDDESSSIPKVSKPVLAEHFGVIFFNHGKTPAIVTGLRLAVKRLAAPPNPKTDANLVTIPFGAIVGTEKPWRRGKLYILQTAVVPTEQVEWKTYLFGEITYRDILRSDRSTWFCREMRGSQFVLADLTDEKLNGYT